MFINKCNICNLEALLQKVSLKYLMLHRNNMLLLQLQLQLSVFV